MKNKNEFDDWIINLKKAIGFSTLNDLYEIKEKISSGRCGVVKKGINKKTNEEINQKKAWNAFVLTNFERSEKLVRTRVAAIVGLAKVCSCFLIRFAHILK